jgi:hypothetical protein
MVPARLHFWTTAIGIPEGKLPDASPDRRAKPAGGFGLTCLKTPKKKMDYWVL